MIPAASVGGKNANSDFNKPIDNLFCKFCNRVCKSKNSLLQHELRCPKNPNRRDFLRPGMNVVGNSIIAKGSTKETCEIVHKQAENLKKKYANGELIAAAKGKPGTWIGRHHTKEQIEKMMKSYRFTLEKANRNGRYRYFFGYYKGIKCESSWELAFLVYNLDNNKNIIRNESGFEYEYENGKHLYFPDFIIDNVYYEIKGNFTEKDSAKHKQFPSDKKLIVLKESEMNEYINYCKKTYGDNFYEILYDSDKPSWKDCQ